MKRAFTLVEILVVLGVISLLACILVPSMEIARARAASAGCLGNLKGIGLGLNMYLSENQMTMPQLKASRASVTEQVPVIDNTLDHYVDNVKVFTCPAGKEIAKTTGTSYYWNSILSGQPSATVNLMKLFNDLSKIPVVMDKEGWHKYTDNKVNFLFVDGHAATELPTLFTQ